LSSSARGELEDGPGTRPEWMRREERGSALLVRLMTWISLRCGRRAGRCVLPLIVAYFLIAAVPARRASREYLRRALGRESRWRDLYRHLHAFASVLHDRIYLINDRFDLFQIEVKGGEFITSALASGRGALLMGAHLGSFEIMRSLARHALGLQVTMVMYEENARKVSAALAAVNPMAVQAIIPLGRADSMLRIRERLDSGAIVGLLGDRTLGGDATVPVVFLGEPAALPIGPFRLAAMLRRQVIFMSGIYLGGNRYRIHFEPLADFSEMAPEDRSVALRQGVERFAAVLEQHCRAAPYNWFNFFDFWKPQVPPSPGRKVPHP
jgi:predicted LPLAT superfamily acyltransferase